MSLKSISLFSGAMGLDLGLEKAGFRTRVAVEASKFAVDTILLNKPRLPVINKLIQNVSSHEILEKAKLKREQVDLICGGPCCQSFSTAGARRSMGDEKRGGLFFDFKRIVEDIRPRFFVMENVKGILSAAIRHRPLNQRGPGFPVLTEDETFGSAFALIRKEFSALGYYCIFGLLNCADYGVPQKRYRVIFIGSRDCEDVRLPKATHSEDGKNSLFKWVSLKTALTGVKKEQEYIQFSEKSQSLLGRLKEGQNWRNLPESLHKQALGAAFDSWGGRSGFCRRLSEDKPSPTLVTSPRGRATCLCHPTELRPLSVEEYKRIQEFPDDWKFPGATSQKYIQIGNAVPLGLGKAIGLALKEAISRTRRSKTRSFFKNNQKLLGTVTSPDVGLNNRLARQPKTQLNPVRMRTDKCEKKARRWLASIG